MPPTNVDLWSVTPQQDAEPVVLLEIDELLEFRLTPNQAIQMAGALATAAKTLTGNQRPSVKWEAMRQTPSSAPAAERAPG